MLRKIVLLIGLAMIVSCASDIPSVKTLAEYEQANPPTSKSDDDYLIGSGDVLAIDVWKEPELSKPQVLVRLDGKISLPLLNEVKAAGLTVTGLQSYLALKYQEYVAAPEVSVTVVQSGSKRVYLLGNVTRPGEYPLLKNMTIIQALSTAGGLTAWADTSNIRLIRKIRGVEKHFSVDYDVILSGKDASQNILLQPDDTIYAP